MSYTSIKWDNSSDAFRSGSLVLDLDRCVLCSVYCVPTLLVASSALVLTCGSRGTEPEPCRGNSSSRSRGHNWSSWTTNQSINLKSEFANSNNVCFRNLFGQKQKACTYKSSMKFLDLKWVSGKQISFKVFVPDLQTMQYNY